MSKVMTQKQINLSNEHFSHLYCLPDTQTEILNEIKKREKALNRPKIKSNKIKG